MTPAPPTSVTPIREAASPVPDDAPDPDGGVRALRILGAVTVAYSLAIIAVPRLLAKPCRMTDAAGRTPVPVQTLIRGIGARDTAIGLAMMVAPPGLALTTATACRVVSDAGDAVAFGIGLPDAPTRLKIAGFAVLWAALNAAALARHVGRTAQPR